jgi:hypothetical protein
MREILLYTCDWSAKQCAHDTTRRSVQDRYISERTWIRHCKELKEGFYAREDLPRMMSILKKWNMLEIRWTVATDFNLKISLIAIFAGLNSSKFAAGSNFQFLVVKFCYLIEILAKLLRPHILYRLMMSISENDVFTFRTSPVSWPIVATRSNFSTCLATYCYLIELMRRC